LTSGAAKLSVHLFLAAGTTDVSVFELHVYPDRIHFSSSAGTSPTFRHCIPWLQCHIQWADWTADTVALYLCDYLRHVGFRDCCVSTDRGRHYRHSAIFSRIYRSSHSWCLLGSGDSDWSYSCFYTFSCCTSSTDPDCFTATFIYSGSAWQFRVWGGYFTVRDHFALLGTWHDSLCSPVRSLD
jgi:hypothetical protein